MKISSVVHNALVAAIEKLSLSADVRFNPIVAAISLGLFINERSISDSSLTLDELVKEFLKELSDDSSAIDEAVIAFSKVIADSSVATEAMVLDFVKVLADTAGAQDSASITTGKYVTDSASAASEALAFAVTKYVSETVGATDDFDGEASTLDDQTLFFTKARSEIAFVAETFNRVVQYRRTFDESSSTADDTVISITKVISDAVTVSETINTDLLVGRFAGDTSGVSEALAAVFYKILTDAMSTADVINLDMTKVISDYANPVETVELYFSTARADGGAASDNTLKLPIKSISDSGSLSDAGSYRGQGYCDFDYFLEDYVGYSGVF